MNVQIIPPSTTTTIFVFTIWTFSSINGAAINDTPNFEAAFQGKCGPSSPCVQLCVELHDGTFECQCRGGYRLLVDGYSCVEITNTSYAEEDSEEEWMRRNAIPNTLFHEHHDQERDLKYGSNILGRVNNLGENSISASSSSFSPSASFSKGASSSSSENSINESTKSSFHTGHQVDETDPSANLISNNLLYSKGGEEFRGRSSSINSSNNNKKGGKSARGKKDNFSFANIFKFNSDELPMIYGRSNYKAETDQIRASALTQANKIFSSEDDADDSSSSEEESGEEGEDERDDDEAEGGEADEEDEEEEDAGMLKEDREIQQLLAELKQNIAKGLDKGGERERRIDTTSATTTTTTTTTQPPPLPRALPQVSEFAGRRRDSLSNSINSEEEKNLLGQEVGVSSSEENIISGDKFDSNQSDNPLTRPKQLSPGGREDEAPVTMSAQNFQASSPILPSLSAPSLPLPSSPISITQGPITSKEGEGRDGDVALLEGTPSNPATESLGGFVIMRESSGSSASASGESSTTSTPSSRPYSTLEPCSILQCQNGGMCAKEPNGESLLSPNGEEQPRQQSNQIDSNKYDGYRCLCPMGFHGEKCEMEDTGDGYTSGLFRGHSWVAFPVLHDAYMSDQISIEFRPESPNGILLLTGEREDLTGDFLALYLHSGYLEFRFDCGSGSGMVRSSQPVKLQQWNRAIISRRRWDGWMQLNDGPFTQGRSKGLFSRITFRQPVFIGGSGNISVGLSTALDVSATSSNKTGSETNRVGGSKPGVEELPESDMETESPSAMLEHTEAAGIGNGGEADNTIPGSPSSSGVADVAGKGYKSKNNKIADDAEDFFAVLPFLRKMGGFMGCLKNLVINDRAYRFGLGPAGDAIQGFDVENCNDQGVCDLVHCLHGGQCIVQKDDNPICLCPLGFTGQMCETSLDLQIPSFNGSSYLKYAGLGLSRVLSWLEIEVIIKPDALDGLILYNGYKTDGMGDFISLILDGGYVEFGMDLGTGAAIIRSNNPLTMGEWHRILVSRTSRLISIKIDHQNPIMALTPGAFTQLSLPHNLFLGGIPDLQWLSPKVKVHSGFSGCIQKLIINEKPLRIMGSAMSGVNLENCAHPCLRNPCYHGGECMPQLDGFKCHCPLGYRDSYCQTSMDQKDMRTAPKLIGDSYLRYTNPRIIKRISGSRLNLSFRLRTTYPRGLIIWAGRKMMTSASDFFSMGLRHGLIQATFSLGSGQTNIAYNYTIVSDGQWHLVRFVRNEQEASLTVDDGPPVIGVAPGKLRQLNINDGLYIGGLDDPRHQSMNKYSEGLVGCITDLSIGEDYRVSLLRDASEGRNVDYCED